MSYRLADGQTTRLPFQCLGECGVAPAGDRFVVTESASGEPIVRIVTREGKELASFPGAPGWGPVSATWSPDGERIALVLATTSGGMPRESFELELVELTQNNRRTSVVRFYAPAPKDAAHVVFSPDSHRLMFDAWTADTGGSVELFTVGLDGSGLERVTTGGASAPSWRR